MSVTMTGRVSKLYGRENDVIETGNPLVAFGEARAEAEVKSESEIEAEAGTCF